MTTPTPDETIYYWCLTFGQRYATEPHPRFPDAHPDGWVEIAARTRWDARSLALSMVIIGFALAFLAGRI